MGNRISKWWSNTKRSCRNVTCLDPCFSCFQRSSKLKRNDRRSLTLETVSMPYIDETADKITPILYILPNIFKTL
ncbi:hypothetical protein PVAND_009847 [Polypedilum vanderplanki]|uniref:Uncharacterized protein n=1 Tax=Polypedilum vanderplanki TaxID=319348 RepID=A0A9J6CEU6_POLVA|nr:hypothetical protein PVAND_009847 [Polypedilum vanderplanki]